jgi:hypothetical protein
MSTLIRRNTSASPFPAQRSEDGPDPARRADAAALDRLGEILLDISVDPQPDVGEVEQRLKEEAASLGRERGARRARPGDAGRGRKLIGVAIRYRLMKRSLAIVLVAAPPRSWPRRRHRLRRPAPDVAWPRERKTDDGTTITVYQPQLERWADNNLSGRAAVSVVRPARRSRTSA